MKKLILILLALLNATYIFAQKNIFIASDLTKEGEFTNNCEGPSVDKDGNERGPKPQLKELMGIGLAYRFKN